MYTKGLRRKSIDTDLTLLDCIQTVCPPFSPLFSDFFPYILGFLRRLPVIGNILSAPGIARVCLFFYLFKQNPGEKNVRARVACCILDMWTRKPKGIGGRDFSFRPVPVPCSLSLSIYLSPFMGTKQQQHSSFLRPEIHEMTSSNQPSWTE